MTQAPGWYDDPQDATRLRYWDGVLWSEHTTPKQSPTASASTIGHPTNPYAAAPGPGYAPAPQVQWRPSGPTTVDGRPLGEWWQRLLAAILDNILVGMVGFILALPWTLDFFRWYIELIGQLASQGDRVDMADLLAQVEQRMTGFALPVAVIGLLVKLAYETYFLTRSGATLGKMALGIRVRRTGRPGPLTLVEALRRQALQLGLSLVGLVPGIGLLTTLAGWLDNAWLIWDPRRQTWHDKIADTVVEKRGP